MSLPQGSFPKSVEADWRRVAERALKGKPPETLMARSEDGIAIGPIYPQRLSAEPLASRPGGRRWRVAERIDHPNVAVAREMVAEALRSGVNGLDLVFSGSVNARGGGIAVSAGELLKGLPFQGSTVRIDGGEASPANAAAIAAEAPRVEMAFDPLAGLAGLGRLSRPLAEHYAGGPALIADMRPYHAAGATEAEELGIAAATLIAHWRALEVAGGSLDQLAAKVAVTLVAEADELMTIAKLRAMRRLHARLLQAAGLVLSPLALHVETSWRMLTTRDPYTNMLRSGVAAFGAVVGGASSITVLPFTSRIGLADAFAARQARNTQLLLSDESNLHRVHDPAAGAGAVEKTTEELAAAGWRQMQAIEGEGGLAAALKSGSVQRAVAASAKERSARFAAGERKLIGVNLAREGNPPNLPVTPFASVVPFGGEAAEHVTPLVPAPFEDAAEAGRAVA